MDSPIAKVLEAKSRHVEKVDLSATVASAVGLMNEREIGSVLVFDGTRLVGIFTERDVLVRRAPRSDHGAGRRGDDAGADGDRADHHRRSGDDAHDHPAAPASAGGGR